MKASTDSTAETKAEPKAENKNEIKKDVKTKKGTTARTWKGWLETMNVLEERHPRLAFWGRTAGFYFLMMALFLYFMLANLSTAPKFVYTQF